MIIGNVKNAGAVAIDSEPSLLRHLTGYCFQINHHFDFMRIFMVIAGNPVSYRLWMLAEGHE